MKPVLGLLLAAGSSSRFGSDKLSRKLPDGCEVAVRACLNLLAGTDGVLAVVRPGADELAAKLLQTGATVMVCAEAEKGMGVSLGFGIRSSPPTIQGWLVGLADMPWIEAASIRAVAEAIRQGDALAAPCYRGRRGHPVGFSADFRQALAALAGDGGAKGLIQEHAGQLRLITVEDPGILRDIDLPADLASFP